MTKIVNQQAIRRRFEARELLNRLKSRRRCTDCNGKFHSCQMDFLRKDGTKSTVSRLLLRSQKAIMAEIELCDLVCANCGRLRVWKLQRAARAGDV